MAGNGFGIVLNTESSADPVVEHNTVVRNHSHGIYGHWEGRGSVITRNEIRRNGGSGIHTTGFSPCPELRDNHVSRNEGDGIFVTESPIGGGPSECSALPVTGNTATRNAADGIHVADNTMAVITERNRTDQNGDDGIDVGPARFANLLVTLTSNRADRNADLGIEAVDQVTDGGGNRARRNGDPRQCVGVACR